MPVGMKTWTLFELNQHLRRTISLNFPEPVWAICEISSIKNHRGHWYLDLIQKDENTDNVVAKAQAVIWKMTYDVMSEKHVGELNDFLKAGHELRLYLQVTYHEMYGFKYKITDIDPAYTIGKLEEQKLATLATLKKEDLIHKNAKLDLPIAIQRIAAISSNEAAGWADFSEHLSQTNPMFYYNLTLFPAALQGVSTENEVLFQLEKINERADEYDIIAIIRGGGAKMDLAAFDNLKIAQAIANSKLPVFTGIGHETDQVVADIVAHSEYKTPTAVAVAIYEHNLELYYNLQSQKSQLAEIAYKKVSVQNELIKFKKDFLLQNSINRIEDSIHFLQRIKDRIKNDLGFNLKSNKQKVSYYMEMLKLMDPSYNFKRGFALIEKDGKRVKSVVGMKEEELLLIHLGDGKMESKVKKIHKNGK